MNTDERICSIALSLCTSIGPAKARRLVEQAGSASALFAHLDCLPDLCPDATPDMARALSTPGLLARAERELAFAAQKRIDCLTLNDARYPTRLRHCEDAPTCLFFRGNADLNRLHIVSIVGTRRPTGYGCDCCTDFVRQLSRLCPDVLVISGLAYGIDVTAHHAALACGIQTIGVLAHGLDRIYPAPHRQTAICMLDHGGLLTEYPTGTQPERHNFVSRNRIVAGMTDATIVMESGERGGSLITAGMAYAYQHKCFALPGRITDGQSTGCNRLIRQGRATPLLSVDDFLTVMQWHTGATSAATGQGMQRELFPQPTPSSPWT